MKNVKTRWSPWEPILKKFKATQQTGVLHKASACYEAVKSIALQEQILSKFDNYGARMPYCIALNAVHNVLVLFIY